MRAVPMIASLLLSSAVAAAEFRDDVIEVAKLQSGLAAVIGCGDAQSLPRTSLHTDMSSNHSTTTGRPWPKPGEFFSSVGVHGRATSLEFDGKRLPYVDNLVNLLVVRDMEIEMSETEMDRVLARAACWYANPYRVLQTSNSIKWEGPLGPWEYCGAILVSDQTHKAPGHHSFIRDPAKDQSCIFYHRWDNVSGAGPYRGSRYCD